MLLMMFIFYVTVNWAMQNDCVYFVFTQFVSKK